jgi:hypothetical protein
MKPPKRPSRIHPLAKNEKSADFNFPLNDNKIEIDLACRAECSESKEPTNRHQPMSIGQKRQREEAHPQQAPAPKNKTCLCGSKVSDTEVLLSGWTLGTGLQVQQCTNCC